MSSPGCASRFANTIATSSNPMSAHFERGKYAVDGGTREIAPEAASRTSSVPRRYSSTASVSP